jgi:peroxiredoxin
MLTAGTRFPDLELRCVDGSTLTLPEGLAPGWSVVLFYRGHF